MRRWTDGLRDIEQAAAAVSRKTRVISVMDREADFFELFDEQRRLDRVEVLVRAKHDRCLAKGAPKLFETLRAGAADGHVEIEIDRVSERRKSSRATRPARTGRVARAEVRHRKLSLPPTRTNAEPAALSAVHVREIAPPPDEPAVEWFLLTSLDVDSTETAVTIIGYYLRRWRIEDLFRVLKSGCRAEHLAFHTADRLQRALTINTVIAWRLMVMTLLGRDVPASDPQLLFTDIELRFLNDYAAEIGLPPPNRLAAAVLLLAILGGYQNRTHDPPPGHQIMWRGLRTNLHRHHRLPHCPEEACRNCPERIVGTGQGYLDDVCHPDRAVFPPLDGEIDVPPGRLGALVEVAVQVHGPDRNGLERLVAQRQGRVGGIQGEVALTVEAARQQPATPRVMITTDEEPVAGAGAQIEHQARIEPRVGVSDITQADDRVVGPDEALPLGQQMVVHGSDVGKGAVEDLEGARVAEVQIGPYPGPLRGNVDHRGCQRGRSRRPRGGRGSTR